MQWPSSVPKYLTATFRLELNYFLVRRGERKVARVVKWSLVWLYFFLNLFLNSCFKCMKTKHKLAVKYFAVCQIFTAANMFCSNYLFQLENDSSQDCSNGGIVSDVFGDWTFWPDVFTYWIQVRKLYILVCSTFFRKINPPNSDDWFDNGNLQRTTTAFVTRTWPNKSLNEHINSLTRAF